MRITTNLELKVWDENDDEFNPDDLAENWDKLDADYDRARPTDRAELLATLPVSDNFAGRLVYLTAANGGFPAHTLVRFDGSAWRAVGPHEIHSTVPATGNYAGRVVLLSAADSGFAAWTMILYNGSSWVEVGRQVSVLAAVPVTGNYNGRVVVLSAADSGFAAWDMIVYDGSAYRLTGPSKEQPVASSIGSLTTANGRKGAIVTSPELIDLTYSTGLSNKWIESYKVIGGQLEAASTTSTTYNDVPQSAFPTSWHPWGVLDTAALKPALRVIAVLSSSNASGTCSLGIAVRAVNAGATPGSWGTEFGEITNTGTAAYVKDSGWVYPTVSGANVLNIGLRFKSNNSSYTSTVDRATLLLRWTS